MNTGDKLTYDTFLHRVSARAGGGVAELDRFLHRIGPVVETILKQEGKASVSGLGAFDLREIAERPGHNPQTSATTTVAAHTHVHFSPFQALKWTVNWPYRFSGFQLLPRYADRDRTQSWQKFAIAALLLLTIGLASWIVWLKNPAVITALAPHAVATEPQAAPIAVAPVAPALPAPVNAFPAQMQVVQQGDNFWDLAGKLWLDTAWWPLLYVENRANLPVAHPDQLPSGTRLQVPALEGGPTAPSEGDLKRLTAAYGLVGQDYGRANDLRAANYLHIADQGY